MQCFGPTGAISRLLNGVQSEWITGLPSLGTGGRLRGGGRTAMTSRSAGNTPFGLPGDGYFTIGLAGTPAGRAALGPAGEMMGKLWKVNFFGGLEEVG